MDFFTVPTLTFGVLYGFFVIAHDRRRILHCNVTRSPEAVWVALQLRPRGPHASRTRERYSRSSSPSKGSTNRSPRDIFTPTWRTASSLHRRGLDRTGVKTDFLFLCGQPIHG
jgi:hypothetical protein